MFCHCEGDGAVGQLEVEESPFDKTKPYLA